MSKYPYRKARGYSYGGSRSLEDIKYLVIHYTGNDGDTAKNNVDYFATGNKRYAGAHFFVDQKGNVWQSVPIDLTAWSVGDDLQTTAHNAGSFHNKCKNSNSISIELCDCASKDPSTDMIKSVRGLVSYLKTKCPNIKAVIRHWDVTGKDCPHRMTGATPAGKRRWAEFKKAITNSKTPPYPTRNLYYGYQNEQVMRLQRCLNKIDHAGLTVDGNFGPKTSKAVKHFKKKHMGKTDPTDKVGAKTRAKIKELLKK